jgi:beta-lactamase class A
MGRIVPDISRRAVMGGTALLLPLAANAQIAAAREIRALEKRSGARIGLAAIDTGSARSLFNRESQRFMMCSSFKLSLAAAVLARVDKGAEQLGRVIHYGKAQLLPVSPATTRNLATGMTIRDLCEAICIYSDNTGANLLLAEMGGPAQLTRFWRGLGDETTRLDRTESALNVPDGDRDTTTPAAMLDDLKAMLLGDALSPASRALLLTWMHANTTGGQMLRSGLPLDWQVGDKTGHWISSTDLNAAAVNDLAIITPPGRKPILAVALTRGGSPDDDTRVKVLADIGRILAAAFA